MTSLLVSALFPECDPVELAALALELGFDGIDLTVRGLPRDEDQRAIEVLRAEGAPVGLITTDTCAAERLSAWAALAKASGCGHLRTAPWVVDEGPADRPLAELVPVAQRHDVVILVPNQAGSRFGEVPELARELAATDPRHVAAMLAPDQVPRWRDGEHGHWLWRMPLPPVGGVGLANYRWVSQVGAGNVHLWSTRPALAGQGLTPWSAWLQRLFEIGYDGLFSFGDGALAASPGDRLHIARDDLRFVRRVWRTLGGRGGRPVGSGRRVEPDCGDFIEPLDDEIG